MVKTAHIVRGKKTLIGFNDLQTINPKLAAEWHPTKNGNLKPTDVRCWSNKKVWWVCNNGHQWIATINSRSRGNGCKVCAGQSAIPGVNDLLSQNPDLAAEWDYDKNNLGPDCYAIRSNVPVWWICKDCGFSWKASPDTRSHSDCPKCSNDYRSSFGEKAISYYLSQIVPLVERYRDKTLGKMELDLYIPSLKVAIEYDGQFFHQNVERDLKKDKICLQNGIHLIRFRETFCPRIESHVIEVDPLSRDSLTSGIIQLINYLYDNYNIGRDVDVNVERDITKIQEAKYLSRKNNSLASLFPKIAEEFHPTKNGSLKVDVIPAHSNEKVWWLGKCGHEWQAVVSSRVVGRGCPYCAGRKVWLGFNDLATTHPELAAEWHPTMNDTLKPTDVTSGSHKKIWWQGKCGHIWNTNVYHRTAGRDCPYCAGRKTNNS